MDDSRFNTALRAVLTAIAKVRVEHQAVLENVAYKSAYVSKVTSLMNELNNLELKIREMP